ALMSFVMVGLVLHLGLRCGYLVFASLLTLVVGLIATLGFALFFLGRLNMISIAFAVLFIGLGIDYSIQFCLRYRELVTGGATCPEAIRRAARDLGPAFGLCLVTTAIGFYAFVPTAYAGASELGIISGTGMFINFFTNLTVLPALLALRPLGRLKALPLSVGRLLSTLPEKHAGKILAATLVLGLAGAALLPKVYFDFNPLNLSNPSAESVVVTKELFQDRQTSSWSISVLTDSGAAAAALSQKLKGLPEVGATLTLADFVPGRQSQKLEIIADAALFMPVRPDPVAAPTPGRREQVEAFNSLEATIEDRLQQPAAGTAAYRSALERLRGKMEPLGRLLDMPQEGAIALDRLEEGLLSDLRVLIDRLEGLLQPAKFFAADLPPELTERYVSSAGHHRVQVLPRANLMDMDALKRFVDSVRQEAPQATDAPVTILESGRAIVAAFWRASLGALLVIGLLLLVVFKRPTQVAFILMPLLLAIVLTAAATVLLGVPFNFANIIVVPLLLGTGVDYGIHLVYRFRLEAASAGALLASSTSRAVLFSALTTVMSFGSLAFLRHRGTASMGILLSLCIGFMILSTLVVLPALLRRYGRRGL
ncbi:MAG: MMPL family transporter, partial [Desulfobacterales bacterium]|nr:MMPL family transporter [Desulfobacterales bacterium]